MFGIGRSEPKTDRLSVQVHLAAGDEAFKLAQKLWEENARTMRFDEKTGKEFLHFAYANPKCVVWMQRDRGRTDTFELIIRWERDQTHEVYVLTGGQTAGDEHRAKAIITSMLTTPSVVPSADK